MGPSYYLQGYLAQWDLEPINNISSISRKNNSTQQQNCYEDMDYSESVTAVYYGSTTVPGDSFSWIYDH
jgi:hypothetical protein